MLLLELDEVSQLLHEVDHLLFYEVGQLLYKVGQQAFADRGCGRLCTRVDLQYKNPLIFHPYNQLE